MKHTDKSATETGPRTAVLEAETATAETVSQERVLPTESTTGRPERLSPTLEEGTDRYRLVRPTLEI